MARDLYRRLDRIERAIPPVPPPAAAEFAELVDAATDAELILLEQIYVDAGDAAPAHPAALAIFQMIRARRVAGVGPAGQMPDHRAALAEIAGRTTPFMREAEAESSGCAGR